MKKTTMVWALAALVCSPMSATLAAGTMETGPGCGLGAMLWADSSAKKHILQQSMIATTNATGMQTFAITSGTSGCTNDGVVVQNEKVNVYAGISFQDLIQEMAQGSGEHLVSLASLLGVPVELQPEFFTLIQQRYEGIIGSLEATPATMLQSLYQTMAEHPSFAPLVIKS